MSYRESRRAKWDDRGSEHRGREKEIKRRKTRWADPNESVSMVTSSLSAIPKALPAGITVEQQEALLVRVRIDEITKKLNMNELDLEFINERSPSPEPIYDMQGKRINTRDQRARDKLIEERQRLVELALIMNPKFKPPADYTPAPTKKMKKITIPVDKFPEYNFIGLIIGPRGNTQKRMEKETGCKIAIRGKGSVKEGKNRKDGKYNIGEDEPLHVLLTADSEAALEKASKMIHELLVPIEEGKNEHKRQQLRELAEINGTLRERFWMAPDEASWTRSDVKCQICGEVSHPTSDCPLRGKGVALPPAKQQAMDNEYQKFLAEIGETDASKDSAYNEFMAALKPDGSGGAAPPPWAQQQVPMNPQAYPPQAPWAQQGATPAPWGQTAQPWGQTPQTWGQYPVPPWQQSQQSAQQ